MTQTGVTWKQAQSHCADLGYFLPGQGWRLPTERELHGLIDRSTFNPATSNLFSGAVASSLWSATPYSALGYYWKMGMTGGYATAAIGSDPNDVRCVRGGPSVLGSVCGDGVCDGEETLPGCATDCAFLGNRHGGPCSDVGSQDTCAAGFACVKRSAAGGGSVCVADFDVWMPLPVAHTVSDFSVGLDAVTDNRSGLMWSQTTLGKLAWTNALLACQDKGWGGWKDWRLPTVAELASLIDFTSSSPASAAPGIVWSPGGLGYWTGSADISDASKAWNVNFQDGEIARVGTANGGQVICVRDASGDLSGMGGRFFAPGDGKVVLDRISGLHWEAGYKGGVTFAAAEAYCTSAASSLPGSGWRLPTVTELRQLVSRAASNPAVAAPFVATPAGALWTATLSGGSAWVVAFSDGASAGALQSQVNAVRCVR